MAWSKTEIAEAREFLRKYLKPGDTVHAMIVHASHSGMTRVVRCFVADNGDIGEISMAVAKATDSSFDRNHWGVRVGGCGFDAGSSLIQNLSYYLFPDGFDCIGENCPSNAHVNGDRDYSPGRHHREGGYALRYRSM